jgi:hypothetical protein
MQEGENTTDNIEQIEPEPEPTPTPTLELELEQKELKPEQKELEEDDDEIIEEGLALPKTQYIFLFRVSNLIITNVLYALHREYYDLAIVPLCVWLSSINYWRKPDYSWRRYLDMACVHIGISYEVYRAYSLEHGNMFCYIVFVGCICYIVACYYYQKKKYWISTLLHALAHIIGNIGNLYLYSGDCSFPIQPPVCTLPDTPII